MYKAHNMHTRIVSVNLKVFVWNNAKPGKQRQSLLGMIGTKGEVDVCFWIRKWFYSHNTIIVPEFDDATR